MRVVNNASGWRAAGGAEAATSMIAKPSVASTASTRPTIWLALAVMALVAAGDPTGAMFVLWQPLSKKNTASSGSARAVFGI